MSDDEEGALPLPECPPDKPERWRSVEDMRSAVAVRIDKRDPLVDALEAAAIRLRDAELEKQAAGKAYAEALDAFNKFVAPTPTRP